MENARKALDFPVLDDFDLPAAPARPALVKPKALKKAVDKVAAFPSREADDTSQLNIKAPTQVLEQFKAMAKKDRYNYGEFLHVLMEAYGKRK